MKKKLKCDYNLHYYLILFILIIIVCYFGEIMSVEYLGPNKNNTVIDLSTYIDKSISSIIITKDILSLTLTSHNIACDISIIISPRDKNLNLSINDLYLESTKEITMNFSGGKTNGYRNKLTFSGINQIISKNNIAICISNNQTLEIIGKKSGLLKVRGGSTVPAVGNNLYTAGNGHLIIKGSGDLDITGGLGENNNTKSFCNADISADAISFYNESESSPASIDILENINVVLSGEKGQDVSSISLDNTTGQGGCGISVKGRGRFNKTGKGILIIKGGNGGNCVGNISCGKCSDGGSAIFLGSGKINILKPATLFSGDGGSAETVNNKYIIAKGGNGGDVFKLCPSNLSLAAKISYVNIGEDVEITSGNGGTSGINILSDPIGCYEGGRSGHIINAQTYTEVTMGTTMYTIGEGGQGGIYFNKKGLIGKQGILYLGKFINVVNDIDAKTFQMDNNYEKDVKNDLSNNDNTNRHVSYITTSPSRNKNVNIINKSSSPFISIKGTNKTPKTKDIQYKDNKINKNETLKQIFYLD